MSDHAPVTDEGAEPDRPVPDLPAALAAHALAYTELASALVRSSTRSLKRKLLGGLLVVAGVGICILLLTVGIVAAAWDTDHRWLVLLLVAGAYLVMAVIGIVMLTRKPDVQAPMDVLVEELRKDATLVATAVRERRA